MWQVDPVQGSEGLSVAKRASVGDAAVYGTARMSILPRFIENWFKKPAETDGKVYISGTGRAGTTMLVQLLTELGLDTGFSRTDWKEAYFEKARAGCEWDLSDVNGPQFQKSPYLCDRLEEIVGQGVRISHIIVPVRRIEDAAKSRIKVQVSTLGEADGPEVAGGLWSTAKAADQETVLRTKLANLVEVAVKHDIRMIFLAYPRHVQDGEYTYAKLAPILANIGREDFLKAFGRVSRPELVSTFS
jgi:hypothetical protein